MVHHVRQGEKTAGDRAYASIQEAVDRAEPGDTVFIHAGTYRETVVFPRSGAAGSPITVEPADGGRVVVSGCRPVTGWTVHDAEGRVWKAPMPWNLGKGRNQVFTGNRALIEARHPNTPDPGLGNYVSDLSPLWPTFAELSIPDPEGRPGCVTGTLLEGYPEDYWKGACYIGVHYEGWCAQTGIVESSADGEINVGDRTRAWWFGPLFGAKYRPEEGRGMLVGHMHALDRPGEWHWEDGTLYLIPLDGEDGEAPEAIEAKERPLAFDLSGREHIHIRGIEVFGASMRLADSAYCVVEECEISYVSHFTHHYAKGQIEECRNTIYSGETGIFVGGHDNAFLNCSVRYSAGAGFHLRGYHHTIHNCLIDEVSYTGHYNNAVTDAVSDYVDYEHFLVGGHVITYNTMRNAGRHFFNIHGNGTSKASRTRGPMDYMATLFAHNHLYNGMLQTKDAGMLTGYYCSGGTLDRLRTQIIYNVMHDSYDIFAMRIDRLGIVYLDAGTCNVDLHHNLLWAAPGSLQRGLWFNTMCVDIHEHDNPFHPNFDRTCADLEPSDFAEESPFRFGHDFDDPPPLPTWPQLEREVIQADACDDATAHARTGSPSASELALSSETCVRIGTIDFDREWRSVVAEYAGSVEELNTDRSDRQPPRHRKATDPLVLEAIENDGAEERIRAQWTFVYDTYPGSWIRFSAVPLGEGYRRFRVVYGNDRQGARQLEVRLDRPDGPLAGTLDLPPTDTHRAAKVQIYSEAVAPISVEATGTRDVYVVFRCEDDEPVGEFEYFRFEQYRGQIPLRPHEAKLELRIDSATGEKIGELYPRFTGDPPVFREIVSVLEPVSGTHPLFLVVRSNVGGRLGRIRALRLERAKRPIDWTGVGDAPRVQDGEPVYPEPTNLPCARPADRYRSDDGE